MTKSIQTNSTHREKACGGASRRLADFGPGALAASLLLSLAVGGRSGRAVAQDAVDYYVAPTPGLGIDDASHGASPSAPALTLGYILERAREQAIASGQNLARIHLAAGVYTDAAPLGAERFPVALPSELRSLELIGPSEGTARLEMAALEGPVVRVAPNSDVTMAFAAVDFQGGASAIEAMDLPAAAVRISLQGCAFAAQRGQAVRISGAGGGALRLDAANCRFTGSRGGIFAASPSAGRLDVDVSTSEFKDLASYGPGSFLGAGVDVYLEPGGDLGLRVDRCVFRSVASAVQLVESTDGPALLATPGNLRAVLSNNLIHGSSLPANTELGPGSVASGLYLSLWPHHQSAIVIANNTFFAISRFVVYQDNLAALVDGGLDVPGFTFANNICWGVGETSEFAGEAFDAARGGAPKAFPGRGGKVTRNILSRSGWNGDGKTPEGNFRDPPRFLDESGLDFRLSPDSPAIDSGESSFSIESAVDLAGSCRRASRVCTSQASTYPVDLGAYELPGFCDADPVRFVRGDCNANRGVVDLSDSVELFTHLFISQRPIACSDACDANDDGRLDISDGIYILSFLFTGGPAPAPPVGEEGSDPTWDCLEACAR